MATKLFIRNAASDYGTSNNDARLDGTATSWQPRPLSTTAGSLAVSNVRNTVAGLTNGLEVAAAAAGTSPFAWYSPPLAAAATISGPITWNLRAAESSNSANVAINGRLEVIDGATGAITLIDQTARVTELGTSEAAANFAETPAAGVACKKGDRLRVRVFGDDAGTMGTGFTFTFWYDGPTAAASGDSYLTLTETLTFVSEPAGTTIYPTDTASAVSTASVDREAWTSRGAGVQTDVTNTVDGWTAPIQVTDTAGGTVVDWFTRPLTAFTLGGAVRVNVRASTSNISSRTTTRCEVARVAGDGTSATVWGATSTSGPGQLNVPEAAQSYLVSGNDLAISDGQRLRLRFSVDDFGVGTGTMASGFTVTLYYAGTSGGASGDTYLTFTQTLTEYTALTPVTGTGAGTGTAGSSGGTATETISGTGASTGTAATATGTGSVGSAGATGTGAGTQTTQSASGTGVEAITGSGAGTQVAQSGAGTATLALTGTGAGSQAIQTATGSGSSLLAVAGTGAGMQPPATATGDGVQVFAGGGNQVPQSGFGTGTVEGGVEVPPTQEGSTIFAPKLRVISGSGGGVQVRQTAKGRGRVNDDDLVVMAA